ncbi:MarR family winged helix-turn-helix transcriptional regulator [Actinomadura parmotrematis]|uniref:MarR family winged helix-turn-helix transcriptional regulator n=1 Tax=Actinomadura parmotrematis TaxID=2864039 RepID=A0ABS7FK67_9ACTN|nr:MarR family winged helix-turn-helix transcriptional regulator [Actinomadura parmotrematis]MBW8480754.1 MarR family winged helix-turn-helix transcriptional regulator [Actinomadura parmotrematis]
MSGNGIGDGAETDVAVLVRLLGRMVRNVKSHGGGRLIERVKDAGLGPRHMPVMFALVMGGPAPVGALAAEVGLSPATVSQLTGELERAGFVVRSPDEADRRRTIVSVHPDYGADAERFVESRLAPMRMTMERLAPEDRAAFLRGWELLVRMQEEVLGTGPGSGGHGLCGPPDGG